MPIEIIVGLPGLNQGALLRRAQRLRLPVLVSANAFSQWSTEKGYREWKGWNLRPLQHDHGLPSIDLDSAGFVAHVRYQGFPWTLDHYFQLVAAYPFRRFASLDYCVEQEIAGDRTTVLDRISRTIAANRQCWLRASQEGLRDRFMPVLQGRTPDDYERCADSLWGICDEAPIIGVGSMCRRSVHGPDGLLAVVEHLHRILPANARLHLFGVKGQALSQLAHIHERVASIDSQAYGISARQDARKRGVSKTNELLADHMENWVKSQHLRSKTTKSYQIPMVLAPPVTRSDDHFQQCWLQARNEFRALIEVGDIDHDQDIERWTFDTACEIYRGDRPMNLLDDMSETT